MKNAAFDVMPTFYEHFQAGRLDYNNGDFERAREHFNVIIGMFAIYDDEVSGLPEAKMLYRETVQMLGDTYLAERDYDSYRRCLDLFFDIAF